MSSKMPSRTPTLVSQHSTSSDDKARRPSSSNHSLPRGDDDLKVKTQSGTTSPTDKDGKKAEGGLQQGVVAPLQLTRWRFWAIFISLMISIFLFALGTSSSSPLHGTGPSLCISDQLILATAIPKITEAFNSLTELSWLASGFL